jgi:protein-disulfide isomerase
MKRRFGRKGGREIGVRVAAIATVLGLAAGAMLYLPARAAKADDDGGQVLATVGGHSITQRQVDDRVLDNVGPSQLYDLRKQALDSIVDEYVVKQAAKKAGVEPGEYLKREMKPGAGGNVTDAEVRQFYDQHKTQIDQQTRGKPYDQVKGLLASALQRRQDEQRRDELIARLRADDGVKIMLQAPHVKVASAGHPVEGPKDAPVTIVEFSDFQCPFCRAAESSLKQVRDQYGDKVKLVYMDFPLGFHPHAMDAARAGRCAEDQGKFWQYHDALFANQGKLGAADLKAAAAKLGLDGKRFDACFDGGKHDAGIRADMAQGQSLGVTGTPTFFINGREIVGAQPPAQFGQVITEELARAKSTSERHEAQAN